MTADPLRPKSEHAPVADVSEASETGKPLVPVDAGPQSNNDVVVRLDVVGTLLFVVVGGLSTLLSGAEVAAAVVGMVLFAIGVAAFIWSYISALELSRTREVGVANLYLLTGTTAPKVTKRLLLSLLAMQVVVCFVAAGVGFARLTGNDDLNPAAFTIMAPMFGLGLNGLWASRHGRFGPRILTPAGGRSRRTEPRPAPPDTEQTTSHG